MQTAELETLAVDALEELKAKDLKIIDVAEITSITDKMIIACGTSTRHVQSIAENLIEKAKHAKHQPLGVEGRETGEWVLVDLGDIIVHVMLPTVREFYNIEKLWVPFKSMPEASQI